MPVTPETQNTLNDFDAGGYKYGFTSDIKTDVLPVGLNEETIKFIFGWWQIGSINRYE